MFSRRRSSLGSMFSGNGIGSALTFGTGGRASGRRRSVRQSFVIELTKWLEISHTSS